MKQEEAQGPATKHRIRRHAALWVMLVTLVLCVQLIPQSHFFGDDHIQLGVLDGVVEQGNAGPLNLYAFVDGSPDQVRKQMSTGPLPWFGHPQLKVNFFRPLSSVLLALDHSIFGHRAWGYRIQAIGWYLLLIVIYSAWLRRMFGKGGPALAVVAALLVFAISDSHWVNVAWTAGRWVLTTTALGLAASVAHLRWRQEGWRPGRYLSILAFVASLLGGEPALAVLAYVAAYEVVPFRALRDVVRGLAPFMLITALYLLLYKSLGYGAHGVGSYLDPFASPVRYLVELPGRLAAMFGEVFLWVPALAWYGESSRIYSVMAGAGGLAITALLMVPVIRGGSSNTRVLVGRLTLGMFASTLPLAAGTPGGRNLVIPFIGAAALIGILVGYWWGVFRSRSGLFRWTAVALLIGLGVLHLAWPPYRWIVGPVEFRESSDWLRRTARTMPVVDESKEGQRTVFLTAFFGPCWDGYFIRRFEQLPMPDSWWILSVADAEHVYHRVAPDRLVLETVGGEMLATRFESGVRRPYERLREGDSVSLDGLGVRVLEVGEVGPTRVEFIFDRDLDDPSMNLLAALEGSLQRVDPPRVGAALRLPSSW